MSQAVAVWGCWKEMTTDDQLNWLILECVHVCDPCMAKLKLEWIVVAHRGHKWVLTDESDKDDKLTEWLRERRSGSVEGDSLCYTTTIKTGQFFSTIECV